MMYPDSIFNPGDLIEATKNGEPMKGIPCLSDKDVILDEWAYVHVPSAVYIYVQWGDCAVALGECRIIFDDMTKDASAFEKLLYNEQIIWCAWRENIKLVHDKEDE